MSSIVLLLSWVWSSFLKYNVVLLGVGCSSFFFSLLVWMLVSELGHKIKVFEFTMEEGLLVRADTLQIV